MELDAPGAVSYQKLKRGRFVINLVCVQVEQISKEQNYQRYREERFRLTSESTNQRVLWYAHLTFYQPHFSHVLV